MTDYEKKKIDKNKYSTLASLLSYKSDIHTRANYLSFELWWVLKQLCNMLCFQSLLDTKAYDPIPIKKRYILTLFHYKISKSDRIDELNFLAYF